MVWYLWCSRRRDCDRKAAGGSVAGRVARRTGDSSSAKGEGAATGRRTGHRHYTRYGVTGRCEETHVLPANVSLAIMALSWLRIINSPGF
jgi:hypothetical protein